MPQASDELRNLMGDLFGDCISDAGPMTLLEGAGYKFTRGGMIDKPTPSHTPSDVEAACVEFLCDEWDHGYDWS